MAITPAQHKELRQIGFPYASGSLGSGRTVSLWREDGANQ